MPGNPAAPPGCPLRDCGHDGIQLWGLGCGRQPALAYEDVLYDVRTPRTDIRSGGYGFAEVEGIVRACTGYLNAVTYNSTGIDRSAVPRGVLNIWGEKWVSRIPSATDCEVNADDQASIESGVNCCDGEE